MNAVNRQLEEIKRLKRAINKTKSQYIKNDYSKNIRKLQKELKEYCQYRGYNYKEIIKKVC